MVHVPYKGGTPAMIDLLGGNVQLIFATVSTALAHIKAGKIRPLAVTFAKRVEQFPDWPTVAEAGVPGFSVDNWYGFQAPRGTPKPIVAKLHGEINRILETPDVKERLATLGIYPFLAPTPAAFGDYIKSEIRKYEKVVQASGVKVENAVRNRGESSVTRMIQTVLTSAERPDGPVRIPSTSNVWPNGLGFPGAAEPACASAKRSSRSNSHR